jgi:hypothetical protein
MKRVNIIYFCWINIKKNYKNIILGQLDDIINTGILTIANLFIEVCCEETHLIIDLKCLIDEKLKEYYYEINFHTENRYEYYGIKKMYDLAVLNPNNYFLYFHSKGMFNYDNINERHIHEKSLTKGTLKNYEKIIELFDNNSNIMKAALFPAYHHKNNFCWLNFYWSKGLYLITCDNPIITNDRFYYERWSESGDNSMGDVYNLYENSYKKYTLGEVSYILNMLNGIFSN